VLASAWGVRRRGGPGGDVGGGARGRAGHGAGPVPRIVGVGAPGARGTRLRFPRGGGSGCSVGRGAPGWDVARAC